MIWNLVELDLEHTGWKACCSVMLCGSLRACGGHKHHITGAKIISGLDYDEVFYKPIQ